MKTLGLAIYLIMGITVILFRKELVRVGLEWNRKFFDIHYSPKTQKRSEIFILLIAVFLVVNGLILLFDLGK